MSMMLQLVRRAVHVGAGCGMAALLAACTASSGPLRQAGWQAGSGAVAAFDADGRLAVQAEGKGSYANFRWSDSAAVQQIEVNTPLGNTVGVLCRDRQGVVAEDSQGRRYQAATVEELSRQLLGFGLPLGHLNHWVRGHWAADESYQILPDGRLRQAGWLIGRQLAADGNSPRIVVLENETLNIRLVFDRFEPDAQAPVDCALRAAAG